MRDVLCQSCYPAPLCVFTLEVALIGNNIDPLDAENLAGRLGRLPQQAHVDNIVRHRLLYNHLVLGIDGDLNVVANADFRMRRHGAAVGISERYLAFTALLQHLQVRSVFAALLLQRLNFISKILDARTPSPPLLRIAIIEPLEIVFKFPIGSSYELLQRIPREITVLVVDRLEPRAIDGEQLATKEIKAPAQNHELPKDRTKGRTISAAKIGDCLEVWLEAAQEPDHLDVAMTFSFETPARTHPVQVAVDIKLQKIARCVTRTTHGRRLDARETRRRQIKPLDESIDETHWVVGADVIVDRLRKQ